MLAGFSKRVITPGAGIDLAGFGRLDRKNIGVHDDVYVTTLALKKNEKYVLIICADIIGFGFKISKEIKNEINAKYNISEDEILLNASHTHSGPQTLENMLVTLGKLNEDYVKHFKECVLLSVDDALSNMDEVTIHYGKTECNIGINRRLIKDGKASFQPNEDGPSDKSITVLKFMKDDETKAVLFSYACHPSTIGADYVSADYPGVAKQLIESQLSSKDSSKGTIALFMQECCGNIRVRTIEGNDFRGGTWDDVNNFGVEIGSAVVELCKGEMKKLNEDGINISTQIMHIDLPVKEIKTKDELTQIKVHGNVHEQLWAEKMLEIYNDLKKSVPFVIHKLDFGKEFSIIAMSGEVVAEYGFYIKNMNINKTIISAAFSNGVTCYIPTEEMFAQGGYEPDGSTIYYSLPSQLDNSVEKIIKEALNCIISK